MTYLFKVQTLLSVCVFKQLFTEKRGFSAFASFNFQSTMHVLRSQLMGLNIYADTKHLLNENIITLSHAFHLRLLGRKFIHASLNFVELLGLFPVTSNMYLRSTNKDLIFCRTIYTGQCKSLSPHCRSSSPFCLQHQCVWCLQGKQKHDPCCTLLLFQQFGLWLPRTYVPRPNPCVRWIKPTTKRRRGTNRIIIIIWPQSRDQIKTHILITR